MKRIWDRLLNWFIKPSSRAFAREAREIRLSWVERLHGYFYLRWTYLYISVGTGRHPLVRWARRFFPTAPTNQAQPVQPPGSIRDPNRPLSMADTYHGKVIPLEPARQFVQVNEDIRLENLEKIIPYPTARDIVLKNPDHLVALECPCRSAKENPCLPLDVCLIVGEPFASLVMEHHARRAHWISSSEAVAILEAEDRRGHVHHAFFKDAMLGRFYAICNCCACCCGAIEAHQHGTPMLAASGYVCEVDPEVCFSCGYCGTFCQFSAIDFETGYTEIDQAACMGCGICISKCDEGALSLVRMEAKGEPLEIRKLMEMNSMEKQTHIILESQHGKA